MYLKGQWYTVQFLHPNFFAQLVTNPPELPIDMLKNFRLSLLHISQIFEYKNVGLDNQLLKTLLVPVFAGNVCLKKI